MEIAMDEARYEAILRIKENKNPDGGEKIRSQVAVWTYASSIEPTWLTM